MSKKPIVTKDGDFTYIDYTKEGVSEEQIEKAKEFYEGFDEAMAKVEAAVKEAFGEHAIITHIEIKHDGTPPIEASVTPDTDMSQVTTGTTFGVVSDHL